MMNDYWLFQEGIEELAGVVRPGGGGKGGERAHEEATVALEVLNFAVLDGINLHTIGEDSLIQ